MFEPRLLTQAERPTKHEGERDLRAEAGNLQREVDMFHRHAIDEAHQEAVPRGGIIATTEKRRHYRRLQPEAAAKPPSSERRVRDTPAKQQAHRLIRPAFDAESVKIGARRHPDLSETVGGFDYRAVLNDGESSTRELPRVQCRPAAAEDRMAKIALDPQ